MTRGPKSVGLRVSRPTRGFPWPAHRRASTTTWWPRCIGCTSPLRLSMCTTATSPWRVHHVVDRSGAIIRARDAGMGGAADPR